MSDHRKVNLPERVTITDVRKNARVTANLVRLDRETAKLCIDQKWWEVEGVSAQRLREEIDYHWKWKVLISKYQNNPYVTNMAVVLEDGSVQGAMIYRVDGKSVLEPGKRTVLIDRVATAPKNRDGLIANPCYRGAGSGLLTFALCQSYVLGLQARVNLFAAGDEQYYVDRGFVRTKIVHEEMALFELPSSVALERLTRKGMLS
jgi:hypothetical protein